jgi:CBS domain-containing protein
MSARAAWRLESLGYSNVYRYEGGKVDWLAAGLPTEGALANEPRIGSLARTHVATCRLGERVGHIDFTDGVCVVVNDQNVILGDLRARNLKSADVNALVDDVMNPGPVTYRPSVSVQGMAQHMAESGARSVLVSDGDGRLLGLLVREDVERAPGAGTPVLANQNRKEARSHR